MWICSNCGERIDDDFEVCWNCQFGKDGTRQATPQLYDDPTNAPIRVAPQQQVMNKKPLGGIILVLGIVLALYGLVKLSSVESQLRNVLGRPDEGPYLLIGGGILSALIGVVLLTVRSSPQQGRNSWSSPTQSAFIHQMQTEPEAVIQDNGSDAITEQIRRLAKLKDEGILSEEEFQGKKAELLKRL